MSRTGVVGRRKILAGLHIVDTAQALAKPIKNEASLYKSRKLFLDGKSEIDPENGWENYLFGARAWTNEI